MIYGKKSKDELYSCHEQNEKKRCPKCGSLETKKNGFIHSEILSERGKVKTKEPTVSMQKLWHQFYRSRVWSEEKDQRYSPRKSCKGLRADKELA